MDVKKFFADLIATFRKPADPPPSAPVVDVDAAHEAGRNAGYEAGHAEGYEVGSNAEGYEAGYKKGYDEGFQIGFEDKTQQEPPHHWNSHRSRNRRRRNRNRAKASAPSGERQAMGTFDSKLTVADR